MKFLVLGGAGYVGSHFVHHALREGHQCCVVDNLQRGHEEAIPQGVELIVADVRNADLIKEVLLSFKPDVICHYAAYALVGESVAEPHKYYDNNLLAIIQVLNAMIELHYYVPFIFSSSCSIFGFAERLPIDENTPKNPSSPYGYTKYMAERIIEDICMSHGLSAVALRYFNACGADPFSDIGEDHEPETHLIPSIIKSVVEGKEVIIFGNNYDTPDGTCIRDYIHVTDLAIAHLLAANFLKNYVNQSKFFAFNLGTAQGYSNLQIVQKIGEVLGCSVKYRFGAPRIGDPPVLYADNTLARVTLGFEPKYSSLDNIIKTAWKWHSKHPKGF